jgi:exodeoxyribonuclease VII small subunit
VQKKKADFNFETSMLELEQIVDEIEQGSLSLEQAMAQFEKGVKITRECHTALQTAEQKIKILLEKQGKFELADFASDELELDEDDK